MDKYIIIVSKKNIKKAITIKRPSVEEARNFLELIMEVNWWEDGEVYKNDSLTPGMDDAYSIDSTAHRNSSGEIVWTIHSCR